MYLQQLCLRSGSRHSARTSRRCQRQNLLPYDRENCCAAGQPSTLLPTASEAPGSKMGALFYWLGRTPSHPRLSVPDRCTLAPGPNQSRFYDNGSGPRTQTLVPD